MLFVFFSHLALAGLVWFAKSWARWILLGYVIVIALLMFGIAILAATADSAKEALIYWRRRQICPCANTQSADFMNPS
jgi:type VI protein secretion system component VasK